MNKANFNQTGGFPLETDTLDFMQNAYGVFNAVSDLSGHLTILKGCHTTGAQVSDGVVSINGEVLEFKGGSLGPNVMITEEITNKIFEDGVSKPVFTRRYVTFGTVAGSFPWADFKRPSSNIQLTDELAGRATQQALEALTLRLAKLEKVNTVFTAGGGMVLWNKPYNEIPEGWQEVTAWRKNCQWGMIRTHRITDMLNTMGVKLQPSGLKIFHHIATVPHLHKVRRVVLIEGI